MPNDIFVRDQSRTTSQTDDRGQVRAVRHVMRSDLSARVAEQVPTKEIVGGLIAIALWITFFACGLLVATKPLRDALLSGSTSVIGGLL